MREPDLASFFTPCILLTSPELDQNCLMSAMFSSFGTDSDFPGVRGGSRASKNTFRLCTHRYILVLWGKLTKHKAAPVLYQLSSRYESSTVSFLHHCIISSGLFHRLGIIFGQKYNSKISLVTKYNNSNDNTLSEHSRKEFLNIFNGSCRCLGRVVRRGVEC